MIPNLQIICLKCMCFLAIGIAVTMRYQPWLDNMKSIHAIESSPRYLLNNWSKIWQTLLSVKNWSKWLSLVMQLIILQLSSSISNIHASYLRQLQLFMKLFETGSSPIYLLNNRSKNFANFIVCQQPVEITVASCATHNPASKLFSFCFLKGFALAWNGLVVHGFCRC